MTAERPATTDEGPTRTAERPASRREASDYTVAFSPRQIGGFVLIAALVLAVVRWLRRSGDRA